MVFDNPFPTLRAYYDLVRAFQRSLLPMTARVNGNQQKRMNYGPNMATAVSSHKDWKLAAQSCIREVPSVVLADL